MIMQSLSFYPLFPQKFSVSVSYNHCQSKDMADFLTLQAKLEPGTLKKKDC